MLTLTSSDENQTTAIAQDIALSLEPGDIILLSGDLGVGKSVFARAVIRKLAGDLSLEVPSPTYTICHEYDLRIPIAHYDLYRLGDISELEELGWEEFLDQGVAIMEWPENCFDDPPIGAVTISIATKENGARQLSITGDSAFIGRLERSLEIRNFLISNGRADAVREPFKGDASARAYEIIDGNHILMNSPEMADGPIVKDGKPYSQIAHLAENVTAFYAIDRVLKAKGFAVPEILAADLDAGLLLLENLGSDGIIDEDRQPIEARYMLAAELLANMHQETFAQQVKLDDGSHYTIPNYDREALTIEVELLLDWFMPHRSDQSVDADRFRSIWSTLIDQTETYPKTLVLRDYHSPNIIWRDDKQGLDKLGIIDFQDAVVGPQAYDLASLAQDARVDVSHQLETRIVDHYIATRKLHDENFDESEFETIYAVMAAQRVTKILGIFVRLDVRDGKPQYLDHLPRMEDYLRRSIQHPVLKEYRDWLSSVIKV